MTRRGGRIAAALALAAALAIPAPATIWTRSASQIPIPRGVKEPLSHAVYATRDWSVAVLTADATEEPSGVEYVTVRWTFEYRNSDEQTHYLGVGLVYQDAHRRERARFSSKVPVPPTAKDEDGRFGLSTKCRIDEWREAAFAKVTVDFLSTPTG